MREIFGARREQESDLERQKPTTGEGFFRERQSPGYPLNGKPDGAQLKQVFSGGLSILDYAERL
jgi:hypothetical protein